MKIKRIEIAAFGKLKNFTVELSDKFNVCYGENENGKTTVMTFIKCMFYGTGTKKQNLKESLREKYTPWDGSVMGGRIYFENGGVNYCLEREFRGSDSTDRVILTNKDNGKELPCQNAVGESLFGLTKTAFERSLFIDNDVSFTYDSGAQSDFNSRLANVSVSGDNDITQEKVEKRLNDAKNKLLSPTGRAGLLLKDRAALEDMRKRYEAAKAEEKQMSEIANSLEELSDNIEETNKAYEKQKEIANSENAYKNADKLAEYIKIKQEITAIDDSLKTADGQALPITFTKIVSMGLSDYEKQANKADDLKKEAELLKQYLEKGNDTAPNEANEKLQEISKKEKLLLGEKDVLQEELNIKQEQLKLLEQGSGNKPARRVNIPLIMLSVMFAIASVFVSAIHFNLYIIIALIALAVLFLTIGVIPTKGKGQEKAQEQINLIKGEIVSLNQSISAADSKYAALIIEKTQYKSSIETQKALKGQREDDLKQKYELFKAAEEKALAAKEKVILYFSKWKEVWGIEDIYAENEKLAALYERRKELSTALNLYVKDLGDLTLSEANEKLLAINGSGDISGSIDFEAAKANLERLREQISQQSAEKARLETTLATAFSGHVSPQTILRDIKELEDTVKSKEEFVAAAALAIDVLKLSADSMRKSYGSVLESKAQQIFSDLTGGKYGMLSLDNSFKMSAEEKALFGTKSVDFLSRGTTDQAYLSLRLAVSSLLSGEEGLPVMLDDSLSQFDDNRLESAVRVLNDYSKQNQTVLFTCHGNIRDMAADCGANVIDAFV